jgi:hypothetical protein
MAVTKSDVLNAIEQLEANDQKPTNANILAITGGSNATVNKYRSEILNERIEQSFENKIRLNENELMSVSTVFDRILSIRLGTLRAEYEAHIVNNEITVSNLLDRIDVLENLLDEKNNELLVMNHELTEAKAKVSLIQENATAEKENLNRQLLELAKESGKVEFLNSKVEQLERENSEYKRMIENNKKIDDKQQSLLDQPQDTPAKSRKNQKPQNNDN